MHNNYIHSYTQQYIAYLQVQYIAIQSNTQLYTIVLCAGVLEVGAAPEPQALFGQTSRSRNFFQLRLENQNDKKYDNFNKICSQINNGNNEFIECAYDLKSYLLSQTISSTTTNSQITIIYYAYKHHAFNADAASLGMSAVFMCCGSKYWVSSNKISIYNFILALYLLYG